MNWTDGSWACFAVENRWFITSCALSASPGRAVGRAAGADRLRNQNVIYVNILICQLRFICGPGPCLRPIGSETEAYEPSPRQLLGMTRRTRRREGVDVHSARVPACGRDARGARTAPCRTGWGGAAGWIVLGVEEGGSPHRPERTYAARDRRRSGRFGVVGAPIRFPRPSRGLSRWSRVLPGA